METNCSEISLILLFLYKCGDVNSARSYAITLLNYQTINYIRYKRFPFPYDDYYEALNNKESNTVNFTSSLVIENLYEWLILLDGFDKKYIDIDLCKETFKDVSMQSWSYSEDEERQVLNGKKTTGCCFVLPKFQNCRQYKKVLKQLVKGINYKTYIVEKKKISYISLVASRLYRLPVNPYHFLKYLK